MSREVFTTCSTLAVSCVLYQEAGMTNLWGAGIYYDGATCWVVNSSGEITGTASCNEPVYRLFEADKYECAGLNCSFVQPNVIVALQDIYTPNIGKFYSPQSGGLYHYGLVTEVYTGPGIILNPTNYTNCSDWCSS
jgi:hypothetical protein